MHSLEATEALVDIPTTELAKVTGGEFWGQGAWDAFGTAARNASVTTTGFANDFKQWVTGTLKPATPDYTFGGARG